jgi:hypothetical protein
MPDRRITRRKTPVVPPPPARKTFDGGKYTKGFEELFAADLKVDVDVQRALDPKWADHLEATWDPKKVGIIMVSRRENGECYIINGHHRQVVSLRKDPAAILDCEVFEGLSIEEEADLFLDYNTHQKPINVYDKYRIALKAGRRVEQRMAEEVTARALELSPHKGNRSIAAIAACRRIVVMDSAETGLLSDTLMYAEMAFGAHPMTWDANLLQAIARMVHNNRVKLDYHRFVEKLKVRHPDEWQALGMLGVKGGGGSESRSVAMARLMKVEYNKRLSAAHKLH